MGKSRGLPRGWVARIGPVTRRRPPTLTPTPTADPGKVRPTVVSIGGDRPRRWLVLVVGAWVARPGGRRRLGGRPRPADRPRADHGRRRPAVRRRRRRRVAAAAEADGHAVAVVLRVRRGRRLPGQRGPVRRSATSGSSPCWSTPGHRGARCCSRIAARLPASYQAAAAPRRCRRCIGRRRVLRRASSAAGPAPACVRFVADTGSLPDAGAPWPRRPRAGRPTGPRSAPVFDRLGLPPVQLAGVYQVRLRRDGPGQLSTVEAFGPDDPAALAATLAATLDGLGCAHRVDHRRCTRYRSGERDGRRSGWTNDRRRGQRRPPA